VFDFNAMLTPGRRMDELARFLSFWLGDPGPDYGDSPVDLGARALPEPLRRLYAVAGRWPMADKYGNRHIGRLFSAQDALRPLSRLETSDDGKLIFIDENQGVWTVATLPEGNDPPVWVEDSLEGYGTGRWGKVAESLSEFLVTFCLQELVFGSPWFRWDKRLSALFDSGELGPAAPILANGPYVYSKPGRGHSFHLLGTGVLVGRFFGGSLGFAARDAAAASLLDANESEISSITLTTPNS
jgi:hypothetical protein